MLWLKSIYVSKRNQCVQGRRQVIKSPHCMWDVINYTCPRDNCFWRQSPHLAYPNYMSMPSVKMASSHPGFSHMKSSFVHGVRISSSRELKFSRHVPRSESSSEYDTPVGRHWLAPGLGTKGSSSASVNTWCEHCGSNISLYPKVSGHNSLGETKFGFAHLTVCMQIAVVF